MTTPSSQTCAAWVKEALISTDWVRLYDVCFAVTRTKLVTWADGEIHEYVEGNLRYVAEHLRDEASEWHIDGKSPRFEIDEEPSPYIRACAQQTRPLLLKLRRIDPFKFEHICAQILVKLGADAKATQRTADGGVDFVGSGLKIVRGTIGVPSACNAAVIGQAKRYKQGNNIKETQIREFVGAAILRRHQLHADGKIGPLTPVLFAFWTTADFDQNAKQFARASGLWYMDGDTLANYVDQLDMHAEVMALEDTA